MSWMIKANINVMEQILTSIYLGKSQVNQVIHQLSPEHCQLMQSMLMTHPHFTNILHELTDAICQQQPIEEVDNSPENQIPENQVPETMEI